MQGEHPVVGVGPDEGRLGRGELEAQDHREDPAQQEGQQHRSQVHDPDAFVVEGLQP